MEVPRPSPSFLLMQHDIRKLLREWRLSQCVAMP